ncbi:MAG: transketolase [Syntrophobacteraceae bacterium]|nr:transketolase [Syntrophobacteraceae bacterium]
MHDRTKLENLEKISRLIRYQCLAMTTRAGSGHPTSSLSATDLMAGLLFGGAFRYDPDHPDSPNNDRLIFSKGHASPLFYALWAVAGSVSEEELRGYRKFDSPLEGHPTVAFRYTEAATGSLGQGLSIGVGTALNGKYLDKLPYFTYVLLGDSEMAEGSQWEAIQIAAHYKLDNLIAVLDVNRLGQRGETMLGYDLDDYATRVAAFGWQTIIIDGHSFPQILDAYERALGSEEPVMIVARTIKGKGVSFLEDKDGWHGKALGEEEFEKALKELGEIDHSVRGKILLPKDLQPVSIEVGKAAERDFAEGKPLATRKAYGKALARIYPQFPRIVSLDGEVSNSTGADTFKAAHPDRFFEMFIAEQNMVGAAIGLARSGKIPFVSTFAAFFSRAFDQIRMSRYSEANIKFVGSHAGVSIGQDGPSQMGLEDMAMFRAIPNSVVLYPCDAVSTDALVEKAAAHRGIVYIRTTRMDTPMVYGPKESFEIGGSKVLRKSDADVATVGAAGITLHEALRACEELKKEGIAIRVIDLYSVKPLDETALLDAARATGVVITVEDHYPEGGLGEAVSAALGASGVPVYSLAVRKKPKSGQPRELLDFEEISQKAIVAKVKEILWKRKHRALQTSIGPL